jgi:hypothetical protein
VDCWRHGGGEREPDAAHLKLESSHPELTPRTLFLKG